MVSFPFLIATVGGTGYFPKAPGTAGSLVGLIIFIILEKMAFSWPLLVLITLMAFILGCLNCHWILKDTFFQNNDPAYIVVDEVVGMWLTLLMTGFFYSLTTFLYLACFGLFRFFDILKPWPIRWLDHFLGRYPSTAALGIMMDDILAAVAAASFLIASYSLYL